MWSCQVCVAQSVWTTTHSDIPEGLGRSICIGKQNDIAMRTTLVLGSCATWATIPYIAAFGVAGPNSATAVEMLSRIACG
mmetsp:Transcript_46911/g.134112  ORF Transcript_46911/g.134112 Transcript_46911/m.134112 type:complete len:80 (-) Transcript_46911:169-408(-)